MKYALKVTHAPFKQHNFDQYPLIAPQPWELVPKSSTNRKSTTRFPTSQRWTVYVTPKSPKQGHKTRFCYFFPVNFNFRRKKSAAKFLCVKTSSGKVVATSFLCLTVHRRIAGDVRIYLKFVLKVTHPFRTRRFGQVSLNSAVAVKASEKSSISTNRKSTTLFPSSHRWTLCVTPKSPKGWHKTKIFTFDNAFHFFIAGNRRHFKFGVWVEHSKYSGSRFQSVTTPWLKEYFRISRRHLETASFKTDHEDHNHWLRAGKTDFCPNLLCLSLSLNASIRSPLRLLVSKVVNRGRGATGSVDPRLFQVRGPHMDVDPHFLWGSVGAWMLLTTRLSCQNSGYVIENAIKTRLWAVN